MKQLFLFNTSSVAAVYGVGTYIRQLTECMAASGIELTVIHLRANKKKMTVEEENGVRYFDIPSPLYHDKQNQSRNEICYCRSITYLLKPYVKTEHKAVFHLNFMNDGVLCEQLRKAFDGITVITVHYMEWAFSLYGNKNRFIDIVSKKEDQLTTPEEKNIYYNKKGVELLLNNCHRIITVARHERDTLQNVYRIPESKIVTINNALKDSCQTLPKDGKRELRQRFYIEPDEKIILFVGRIDRMKGFPILLKAFEQLLCLDKHIRLLVAGGGNFQEQFSKISGCWSKISFTGFLNKEQLFDLYKIADVGVVPSMYEEFGFVAIEMMMHGLPVVANRTTGLAEIVDDRITGVQVELSEEEELFPISADRLASGIGLLLNNPELREKMSHKSRQKFLEQYEEQLFRKHMIRFYDSLFTDHEGTLTTQEPASDTGDSASQFELLHMLAEQITNGGDSVNTPGLWYGKSGMAIFLYHYANLSKNTLYRIKADEWLQACTEIKTQHPPLDYGSGLTGIASAVLYLQKHRLARFDNPAFFTTLDEKIEFLAIHTDPALLDTDRDIISWGRYWINRIRISERQNGNETLRFQCNLIHLLNLTDRFKRSSIVSPGDPLEAFLYECYRLDICNTKVSGLIRHFYKTTSVPGRNLPESMPETPCLPGQPGLKNGAAGQGLLILQQLNHISADWQFLL